MPIQQKEGRCSDVIIDCVRENEGDVMWYGGNTNIAHPPPPLAPMLLFLRPLQASSFGHPLTQLNRLFTLFENIKKHIIIFVLFF
jgi:hypothetical protein